MQDQQPQQQRLAKFPEHGAKRHPRGFGFRHGKFLPEHQPAVADDGHQENEPLRLPADHNPLALFGHEVGEDAAHDQARRPTRVQNVQVVRFCLRIQRGRQRVDHRFARAVGQGEHHHAQVKQPIGGFLAKMSEDKACPHREHGGDGGQHECHHHERTVASELKKTMANPKPHKPLPVIAPSSVWVNPNSRPQSSRMPLRTANPTPAAIRVMKLPRNKRRWPVTALFGGASTEVRRLVWPGPPVARLWARCGPLCSRQWP